MVKIIVTPRCQLQGASYTVRSRGEQSNGNAGTAAFPDVVAAGEECQVADNTYRKSFLV